MQILVPIVLFFSNFLNYLDRQLFSALLPVLAPAFQLSDPLVGALGSSFTLSYLIAAPLAGFLSDRIHPRRVLAGGVLVFSGGILICAWAHGVVTLFFGRSLTGIGEAALFVVGPQSMGVKQGVGRKLSLFLSAMPIGAAAGFVLATHATRASFRTALMTPVIPGILLGLVLFFVTFPFPDKGTSPVGFREVFSLFRRDKGLLSLLTVEGTNLFVMGGMSVWISLFLTREKHLALSAASSLTGLALITGGFLGILVSGFLCDRLAVDDFKGLYWVLEGSQGLALFGILIVLVSFSTPVLFAGLLIASLGLFGSNIPVLVGLLRKTPALMWGSVLGSVLFVGHLFGDLPSATLIGLVASKAGLTRALSLLLPIPVGIGILSVGAVMRQIHR